MTSIDRSKTEQGDTPARARAATATPSAPARLARAWKAGSACIPAGLSGSLLTCIASVGVNLAIDRGGRGIPAALYLRKLASGYTAAAVVVVVLFPLLPTLTRRLRATARPKPLA